MDKQNKGLWGRLTTSIIRAISGAYNQPFSFDTGKEGKRHSSNFGEFKPGSLPRSGLDINRHIRALRAAESIHRPDRRPMLAIYNDVLKHGMLDELMSRRIRPGLTAPLLLQGTDNENLIDQFRGAWMRKTVTYLLESIFYGYTVLEHTYQSGLPHEVDIIPRQLVSPERGLIYTDDQQNERTAYRIYDAEHSDYLFPVGHRHIDRPSHLGLLSLAAYYLTYLEGNLADFALHNQIFATPLRKFTYDPTTENSKKEAEAAAMHAGTVPFVVVPDGIDVEYVVANAGNNAKAYESLHKIMMDSIKMTFLGTPGTASDDPGSYAREVVNKTVVDEIAQADRLFVEYQLWEMIRAKWIPMGIPLQGCELKFQTQEQLPKEQLIDLYLKLNNLIPIPQEYIYETFGVELPGEGVATTWEREGSSEETPPTDDPASTTRSESPPEEPSGVPPMPRPTRQHAQAPCRSQQKPSRARPTLQSIYGTRLPAHVQAIQTEALDRYIDQLIEALYNGHILPGEIDGDLTDEIANQLFSAIEEGYGESLGTLATDTESFALLTDLEADVHRFSAFKNYQFIRDAHPLLLNEAGEVRSLSQFRQAALKLSNQVHLHHLNTEYNLALATGQSVQAEEEYFQNIEVFPGLMWETVGDDRVRHDHASLDGKVFRVDDPNRPSVPAGYNCRCIWTPTEITADSQISEWTDPHPTGLPVNAYLERRVFGADHPVYGVDPDHREAARQNFDHVPPSERDNGGAE